MSPTKLLPFKALMHYKILYMSLNTAVSIVITNHKVKSHNYTDIHNGGVSSANQQRHRKNYSHLKRQSIRGIQVLCNRATQIDIYIFTYITYIITRVPFNQRQSTLERDKPKWFFLFRWPWPWLDDLNIWPCPRYSEAVPAQQKTMFLGRGFITLTAHTRHAYT